MVKNNPDALEKRLIRLQSKLLKSEGGERSLALVVGFLAGIRPAKAPLWDLPPKERRAAQSFVQGMLRLRNGARQ